MNDTYRVFVKMLRGAPWVGGRFLVVCLSRPDGECGTVRSGVAWLICASRTQNGTRRTVLGGASR